MSKILLILWLSFIMGACSEKNPTETTVSSNPLTSGKTVEYNGVNKAMSPLAIEGFGIPCFDSGRGFDKFQIALSFFSPDSSDCNITIVTWTDPVRNYYYNLPLFFLCPNVLYEYTFYAKKFPDGSYKQFAQGTFCGKKLRVDFSMIGWR